MLDTAAVTEVVYPLKPNALDVACEKPMVGLGERGPLNSVLGVLRNRAEERSEGGDAPARADLN